MQEPCEIEHGNHTSETPETHSALPDILEEDASSDVCKLIFIFLNVYCCMDITLHRYYSCQVYYIEYRTFPILY